MPDLRRPPVTTTRADAVPRRIIDDDDLDFRSFRNGLPDPGDITWEAGAAQAGDDAREREASASLAAIRARVAADHSMTVAAMRSLVAAREAADRIGGRFVHVAIETQHARNGGADCRGC